MHLKTSGDPQASKSKPTPAKGAGPRGFHDTQTGMLLGIPRSARCVQRFDDSLNSAIHITFRTFAAFFIDAKAKRSVVESCINFITPWGGLHALQDRQWCVWGGERPGPTPKRQTAPNGGRSPKGAQVLKWIRMAGAEARPEGQSSRAATADLTRTQNNKSVLKSPSGGEAPRSHTQLRPPWDRGGSARVLHPNVPLEVRQSVCGPDLRPPEGRGISSAEPNYVLPKGRGGTFTKPILEARLLSAQTTSPRGRMRSSQAGNCLSHCNFGEAPLAGRTTFPLDSKYVNDPSAGSPTETLLRLLLPLNDQV